MARCYDKYIEYAPHPVERVDIPFQDTAMSAFLHLPAAPEDGAPFPCILHIGGMDGSKENMVALHGDSAHCHAAWQCWHSTARDKVKPAIAVSQFPLIISLPLLKPPSSGSPTGPKLIQIGSSFAAQASELIMARLPPPG